MMNRLYRRVGMALGLSLLGGAAAAELLDEIKERGTLNCGTLDYVAGVGFIDENGEWSGFDDVSTSIGMMAYHVCVSSTPSGCEKSGVAGCRWRCLPGRAKRRIMSRSISAGR